MDSEQLSIPSSLLDCQICQGRIVRPKNLVCGHCFCVACLTSIAQTFNIIQCPLCRTLTPLPSGGCRDLPTNYLLESLLDDVQESEQAFYNTESPDDDATEAVERVGIVDLNDVNLTASTNEPEESSVERLLEVQTTIRNLWRTWSKTRRSSIEVLRETASLLKQTKHNTNVVKITGSSVGIVGGVTAIAGVILTPLTAGLSLGLTIAGVVGGVAGGITAAGGSLADFVIAKRKREEIEALLDVDRKASIEIQTALEDFIKISEKIVSREGGSSDDKTNLINSLTHIGSLASSVGAGATVLVESVSIIRVGAELPRLAEPAARAATGILSGIFIALDVVNLVLAARDMHKGSPSDVAKSFETVADQMEAELRLIDKVVIVQLSDTDGDWQSDFA